MQSRGYLSDIAIVKGDLSVNVPRDNTALEYMMGRHPLEDQNDLRGVWLFEATTIS